MTPFTVPSTVSVRLPRSPGVGVGSGCGGGALLVGAAAVGVGLAGPSDDEGGGEDGDGAGEEVPGGAVEEAAAGVGRAVGDAATGLCDASAWASGAVPAACCDSPNRSARVVLRLDRRSVLSVAVEAVRIAPGPNSPAVTVRAGSSSTKKPRAESGWASTVSPTVSAVAPVAPETAAVRSQGAELRGALRRPPRFGVGVALRRGCGGRACRPLIQRILSVRPSPESPNHIP